MVVVRELDVNDVYCISVLVLVFNVLSFWLVRTLLCLVFAEAEISMTSFLFFLSCPGCFILFPLPSDRGELILDLLFDVHLKVKTN
jgi:hypothetical protein